jgi:2'-5' RNA ligase
MTSPASVEGDARARLFCALTLAGDALDRIVEWQARLVRSDLRIAGLVRSDLRLVTRENLHVTLAFLGSRPVGEVEPIRAALEQSARRPEPIVLHPRRYQETRSVGMLVLDDKGGAASALAADLHGRLERLGVYEREQRPWLPHLTVVRFRARPRLDPDPSIVGAVSPSGAAVYHSVLRPTGAQYVVLYSVPLSPS